jgi:hypothetical protein
LLEGLKRLRLKLDENPSGLRLDIEWTATMNPHEEQHDFRESGGRVVQGHFALRSGRPRPWHSPLWRQNHFARRGKLVGAS